MPLDAQETGFSAKQLVVVNTIAERVPVATQRMADDVRALIASHTSFGSIAREVMPEDARKNLRIAARIVSLAIRELLGDAEHDAVAATYQSAGALRGSAVGGFGSRSNASVNKALMALGKQPWTDAEDAALLELAAIHIHASGNHAGTPNFRAIADAFNVRMHDGIAVRSYEAVKHRLRVLVAPAPQAAADSHGDEESGILS